MKTTQYKNIKMLAGQGHYPGSGPLSNNNYTEEIKDFQMVLNDIKNTQNTHPVMMEIGAFWAFWSLMFRDTFKHGKNILIEPIQQHLNVGLKNFQINDFDCSSYHAAFNIDTQCTLFTKNIVSFEHVWNEEKLDTLDLLHADIQGAELPLLEKLDQDQYLHDNKIKMLVIATHSKIIHQKILEIFKRNHYNIKINRPFMKTDGYIYATKI